MQKMAVIPCYCVLICFSLSVDGCEVADPFLISLSGFELLTELFDKKGKTWELIVVNFLS